LLIYNTKQKTPQNKKQPPAISCCSLEQETGECGRACCELHRLPGCLRAEEVVNQVVNNLHPTRSKSLTREPMILAMILAMMMILAMILAMMMIRLVVGLV